MFMVPKSAYCWPLIMSRIAGACAVLRPSRPLITVAKSPLALAKLSAEKAWRYWSRSDPAVHYALYQFSDIATLRSRIESPDFKLLVADFDKSWPQIPRSRDLIELVQEA